MSQIVANIKAIRDIMRKDTGVDGDAQRISQMVWMLFLKIFSDKEEEWELTISGYISPIKPQFKWSAWAANEEGVTGQKLMGFINNELFPELKEIDTTKCEQAKIVKAVFSDTYNYMKNGTLFRQVINEINKINFVSSNSHLFNDIYETILKELQSAGSSGEYYTPRAVTQFMVDIMNPQLGDSILDPACGTGGFLTSSIDHISKKINTPSDRQNLQKSILGIEKKPLPTLLCTTNLMLHGFDKPAIRRDNLLKKAYSDWTAKDKVDIILTNPPFGGVEEDGTETNFPQKFRTKETADLFLALIIRLLKDKGRCAVVLPDGSLFGKGVKIRIKEELVQKCNLHTIVRLPKGVFAPYTNISTNILFFEKGQPTKDIWYFKHPYPKGVKNYNKSKPINISEFDLEKEWWNNRIENEYAWKVPVNKIIERNYNLDIENPYKEADTIKSPDLILEEFNSCEKEIDTIQSQIINFLNQALNQ
ncbi:type I restriction-modification system subunit M [Halosquirtibacter xylanolyticus]|uniref:class I SAM-dependent DNA methyltransferase n=1 Tax=Halosquirtibacter xylanolyticus TaxID=3374599 RepID=UPI003747C8DC|nr:type I restriction-modification system subunit M [Prolixibacteraceae bacterium]